MKAKSWLLYASILLYIFASIFIIFHSLPTTMFHETPRFVFHDSDSSFSLAASIAMDHGNPHITRLFHNKALYVVHDVFISVLRGMDPVYLFSLSTRTFYGNETSLLPFWEFPLFALAIIFIIRNEVYKRKFMKPVFVFIITSYVCLGLFLPGYHVAYIPLLISIHLVIGIGFYALVYHKKHV